MSKIKDNSFSELTQIVVAQEEWLMERILHYARARDYTKYTSTLLEAWRISIEGLSGALIEAIESMPGTIGEFSPDEEFSKDAVARFAVEEADKHRKRGVSLSMFMGLMKYYRRAYLDLVRKNAPDQKTMKKWIDVMVGFFDRLEIGFCSGWSGISTENLITELQRTNRELTNEKNKFLTLFESLTSPVFLINQDNRIEHMNRPAVEFLGVDATHGKDYYKEHLPENGDNEHLDRFPLAGEILPWFAELFIEFMDNDRSETTVKIELPGAVGTANFGIGSEHYLVKCMSMEDVSEKFSGMILILENITQQHQLEEKLKRLATTDSLTGIANRRHFLTLAENELARSLRNAKPMSMLVMDIDHFKMINDSYGHKLGDIVLKNIVRNTYSALREYDIFGRLGGEEFGILLPETEKEIALEVAERLRTAIGQIEHPFPEGKKQVTVSIGTAHLTEENETVDDLMFRADMAMYRAKELGRNQVAQD